MEDILKYLPSPEQIEEERALKRNMAMGGDMLSMALGAPSGAELFIGKTAQRPDYSGMGRSAAEMIGPDREKSVAVLKAYQDMANNSPQEKERLAKLQNQLDIAKSLAIEKEKQAGDVRLASLKKTDDTRQMVDPSSGEVITVSAKEPTAGQFAAAAYGRRMQQAEDVFDSLKEKKYDRTATTERLFDLLPSEVKSSERLSQDQAERNFVNAILRRESGAAISKTEFKNAEQQYFDRPGDSADVRAQKKANRDQAIASMLAEGTPALSRIPKISATKGQGEQKPAASTDKVVVRKGDEVLRIPRARLKEAEADGFKLEEQ